MDLRQWFKKIGKNSNSLAKVPISNARKESSTRRVVPPLPQWTRQDSFEKPEPDESSATTEEIADEAMIKRPGAWLKKKMSGFRPEQELQDIEKTKKIYKERKNLADAEMQNFLSDFLGEEDPNPEIEQPLPEPGKKI